MTNCSFIDLGIRPYLETWNYQLELFQKKIQQKSEGINSALHLLFVEHPHVYTFGKSAEQNNLLATPEMLKNFGAEVYHIERGGDITYHGPGQLVAYPIFDLEQLGMGVKKFVESIEQCLINTVAEFGIQATTVPGRIGVWIDVGLPRERKIAAIGIKCSRFVSMHGLALNVNTDLAMFRNIVPCGIPDKEVTSISKETGQPTDMELVKSVLGKQFATIFGIEYV